MTNQAVRTRRQTSSANELCDRLKRKFNGRCVNAINYANSPSTEELVRRVQSRVDPFERTKSAEAGSARQGIHYRAAQVSQYADLANAGSSRMVYGDSRRAEAASRNMASARTTTRMNTRSETGTRVRYAAAENNSAAAEAICDDPRVVFAAAYERAAKIRRMARENRMAREKEERQARSAEKNKTTWDKVKEFFTLLFVEKGEVQVKSTSGFRSVWAFLAICAVAILVIVYSFSQIDEYKKNLSDMKGEMQALAAEEAELNLQIEKRNDIRTIEQIALNEIGMVEADLVEKRFVSVSDGDKIVLENQPKEEGKGGTSSLLSSLFAGIPGLGEYFN